MKKTVTIRSRFTAAVLGFAVSAFLVCFPAAAEKVFTGSMPSPVMTLDPQAASDVYSGRIVRLIYEPLYTYDYLARPAKLVPLTAEALPKITDNGKTYAMTVKKGIYFAPDEAFGGKKRELTADDYIYSIKRLADPKVRSPWSWLIKGKIRGLDALTEEARKTGRFDYDRDVEGIVRKDRYSFELRLTAPDYQLTHILANSPLCAVAREVVEKYAGPNAHNRAHPVGTGPYRLGKWVAGSSIELVKSDTFRPWIWDFAPSEPGDEKLVAEMKGKKIPAIDKIVLYVMEENQSRWLAFENHEIDVLGLDGILSAKALDGRTLKPEFAAKGILHSSDVEPEIVYTYMNMTDPVLGGTSKERIALRRAIAMAHDTSTEIHVLQNSQAVPISYPVPPGVEGTVSDYRPVLTYRPKAANRLLDMFGYKKGADGYRRNPDGTPLTVTLTAGTDTNATQQLLMWRKTFASLGIRMKEDRRMFPEMIRAEASCSLAMRSGAWIADYPDGSNFVQLFYSGNIGQTNHGCVRIPEYDRLFEKSMTMKPGPARDAVYRKMARLLEVYGAVKITYARVRNTLVWPYVLGYKKHPFMHHEAMFLDTKKTAPNLR